MQPRQYTLDGQIAKECVDILAWARWMENADRRVAITAQGDTEVSTVFLGVNHQFGDGPPLIFETMVFGGDYDGECCRYSTWEQAEGGHAEMSARAFAVALA